MELKDLKDPIVIVNLIRTLCDDSFDYAVNDEAISSRWKNNEIDEDEYIKLIICKRIERIEICLKFLDVALINLKIEDEEKYFKFKEFILDLDKRIENIYSKSEDEIGKQFPKPQTIKKHVADLQIFQFVRKSNMKDSNDHKDEIEVVSEVELIRIKDKVAMLIELGIIEHLINKYSYLENNAFRMTKLLSQILNIKENSLKKIINAFETDNTSSTDYPKITDKVKNVIDKLTLEK